MVALVALCLLCILIRLEDDPDSIKVIYLVEVDAFSVHLLPD